MATKKRVKNHEEIARLQARLRTKQKEFQTAMTDRDALVAGLSVLQKERDALVDENAELHRELDDAKAVIAEYEGAPAIPPVGQDETPEPVEPDEDEDESEDEDAGLPSSVAA